MSDQTLNYTFRGNDNTVTTKLPVTAKTANYTVNANDDIARELTFDTTTSDLTASLPTASSAGNGFNVILRNIGTGILTIDPNGTETIDGELTENVNTGQVRWIRCDGLTWRTVAGDISGGNTSIGSGENLLINGGFDIWQRGTSFTDTGYTADRWRADEADGAFAVTREGFVLGQTDVPDEPQYYLKFDMTTSASSGNPTLEQRVEGVRTLAGQDATFSFYAKVASGTLTVTPRFRQNFGTAGSPSADVDIDGADITVTTTWQRFEVSVTLPSISGKLLGPASDNYLSVMLVLPTVTFNLDVANAKLEAGDVATAFAARPDGEEFGLCQRYYQKPSHYERGFQGYTPSGITNYTQFRFATEMRSSPTVTTIGIDEAFFPSGPPNTQFVVSSGFGVYKVSNAAGTGHFDFDWTADAEL